MVAVCVLDTFKHVWFQFFHDGKLLLRKDIFDSL